MEMDKEELIEAYFAGPLSADQQQQLEWLLMHDAVFSETFKFEKETRDTIVFNEREKIRERFQVLEQQTKLVRKPTFWYAAASILILCVVGWLIFGTRASVDTDKLYAENMQPYPNVITPRVRGEVSVDQLMSEALALYDRQAYAEAATLLEQVHDQQPNDQTAFYLAICQLMLKKPEEAIMLLKSGEWHDTTIPTSTVVNWYLGLAFLQHGDIEEALSHFKLVVASNESLSDSAKILVEELERINNS